MTCTVSKDTGRKHYSKLRGNARARDAPRTLPRPLVLALRQEDVPQCTWNNACASLFVPVFIEHHNNLGAQMSPPEMLTITDHGITIKKMFKTFIRTLRKRFQEQVDPPTPIASLVKDLKNSTSVRCSSVRLFGTSFNTVTYCAVRIAISNSQCRGQELHQGAGKIPASRSHDAQDLLLAWQHERGRASSS